MAELPPVHVIGDNGSVDLLLEHGPFDDIRDVIVNAKHWGQHGYATSDLFTFTTSKGDELQYRLVTGDDQREAYARKGATTAEQNTILLSRCITKCNGGLIPDPLHYVRNLGIKDRQEILTALVDHQPSIDLRLTTNCVACGLEVPLALGWGDLFRT